MTFDEILVFSETENLEITLVHKSIVTMSLDIEHSWIVKLDIGHHYVAVDSWFFVYQTRMHSNHCNNRYK